MTAYIMTLHLSHRPVDDWSDGHASSDCVDAIAVVAAWRISSVNCDRGMPVSQTICHGLPPLRRRGRVFHHAERQRDDASAALDECVRTAPASSATRVSAQSGSARAATVMEPLWCITLTAITRATRNTVVVLAPYGDSGNYYRVHDRVQLHGCVVILASAWRPSTCVVRVPRSRLRANSQLCDCQCGVAAAVVGHRR